MMAMGRGAVLFSLIPTTLLLTVSFFVLVVLRKLQEQGLKMFGYVIVALLWLGALITFSAGIYATAKGRCPMMFKMHHAKGAGMMDRMPLKQGKPCPMGEQSEGK